MGSSYLRCLSRALFVAIVFTASSAGAQEIAGHWEGRIETPGNPVAIRVDLEQSEGSGANHWTGTIDFPQRGIQALPLRDVVVDGALVRFTIAGAANAPSFDGTANGEALDGVFRQGPVEADFHLGRGPLEPARRAQDPEPPFPYSENQVRYAGEAGSLAGTLTVPQTGELGDGGSYAAVVLLSGAGAQNRDYEVFGHRPFLVLADALTRAGIAVLRVDDRGIGGSDGNLAASTAKDLADDALRAVAFLAQHPCCDPERIGIVGHSEGSKIAALAASRAQPREVAFVVLLGAPALRSSELMLDAAERGARAQGMAGEPLRRLLDLQKQALDLMASDPGDGDPEAALRAILREQLQLNPAASRLSAADVDAAVERSLAATFTAHTRSMLRTDPCEALALLAIPVLALQGGSDSRLDPQRSFPALAQALATSNSHDLTVRVLPGLNHFFQTVPEGRAVSNDAIEETFSPRAIASLSTWIQERFGSGAR